MESRLKRPAAAPLARMVLDRRGRAWRIAETVSRTYDASAVPCLVLSTQNRFVRLRNYPDRWMSLTVEELLELAQAGSREPNPPSRLDALHQDAGAPVRVPVAIGITRVQRHASGPADDHALTK
jgi:hypothetical protein